MTMDVAALLPHRFPILLVDRVLEVVPGERVRARKAVTRNEPCFARHPAGRGGEADLVYPAVLLLESWCQAAVLLVIAHWDHDARGGPLPLLGGVTRARFTGGVRPGDVVEHEARVVRAIGDDAIFTGSSTVDGHPVLEVERMSVAVRTSTALQGSSCAPNGAGRPGDAR